MTTKECGVLSFVVGIAVAGLLREVPTSIFWDCRLLIFLCTVRIERVAFYIKRSQTIYAHLSFDC